MSQTFHGSFHALIDAGKRRHVNPLDVGFNLPLSKNQKFIATVKARISRGLWLERVQAVNYN
jgi:hypothetical protein